MIEIKYNCPESFDDMPKKGCELYCSVCDKNVHDFRGKTLDEIQKIKAKNPSIDCGVFDKEVSYVDTRSRVSQMFRIAFAAIFVLGFNAASLFGGQFDPVEIEASSILVEEKVAEEIFIEGTIVNHRNKPLSAKIYCTVGEEQHEFLSAEDGTFKIQFDREYIGKNMTISFYADGMYSKSVFIDALVAKCYVYEIQMEKYKRPKRRYRRRHAYGGKF